VSIITVATTKGGAGKTTIARLILSRCAHLGLKVAAVDTDLAEAYAMATVDSDGDDTSDSVLHSQWTRISPMG